jgi:hypothetical protein
MSVLLQAPWPALETTSVLPNPQFNDIIAPKNSVVIRRAMDGTKRTYVKSNARCKLNYTFMLSRDKALEVRAFLLSYYRAQIQLVNHLNDHWVGYLLNNPFEFLASSRADGTPGGEMFEFAMEFEGIRTVTHTPSNC